MKDTSTFYTCDLCGARSKPDVTDRKPISWGSLTCAAIFSEERRLLFSAGGPGVEADVCPGCYKIVTQLFDAIRGKRKP